MKKTLRPSITLTIATIMVTAFAVQTASASLADSAGIWETQPVEATLVRPDGAKASADLGAARTAALGHLDSDGVADLVVAYGSEDRGFAVVTLGDARFRLGAHHDRERELAGLPPERPFATEGVVYDLPFAPDWVAVGDYDSDGDFDVVFAVRGRSKLFWMAGDGQARLDSGRMIDLEAGVTAFASGDVNRRDGLNDLVLGVDGKDGPGLLVFESPKGALTLSPERIEAPARVTSVAIDWLDDDVWNDIAAAAGNVVVVASGRDRKMALRRDRREAVGSAATTEILFDGKITDLAAGNFIGRGGRSQLAVRLSSGEVRLVRQVEGNFAIEQLGILPAEGRMTAARVTGIPGHDLLLSRPSSEMIEIHHVNEAKASANRLESLPVPYEPASFVAFGRLNLDTRDDLVLLGDDGTVAVASSKTNYFIEVTSDDDTDDGTCNASHCSFREAIDYANGLPAGSTINFDLPLGATLSPSSELPALTQTAASIIDGTVGSGILTGPLTIDGSSITGTANGLIISGGNAAVSHLIIGGFPGTVPPNETGGILLDTGGNNTVTGCRLGVGATGSVPNLHGLIIRNSSDNVIGGTGSQEGNIISGNQRNGISIKSSGSLNQILGNVIGLDGAGTSAIPNGESGVSAVAGQNGEIGSTVAGGGNTISGNSERGIKLSGTIVTPVAGWLIQGNIIGLDVDGQIAVSNSWEGIRVDFADHLTIGGTTSAARNVISATENPLFEGSRAGIWIDQGASFTQIMGNYIGTDGQGLAGLGNVMGIVLFNAEEITIGGTVVGAGNVISGNQTAGIWTEELGPLTSQIDILGNAIGPAENGDSLGNNAGMILKDGQYYTIGTIDAPNTIAFNTSTGIKIEDDCTGALIGPNSIHSNGFLGIDLGGDGVTGNDALDVDTGANYHQNFPEIEFVDAATGDVDFFIDSVPSTTYELHFFESSSCDASGYGEGKTYLGSATVTTEANGNVGDQVTLGPLTPGAIVTATATDQGWNTSEFSPCFMVPVGAGFIFADGFESGDTTAWIAK